MRTVLSAETNFSTIAATNASYALLHVGVGDDTERAKREVEAEAVAYVVGRHCGLDVGCSAFYLAAWAGDDPEVVRERLARISHTAGDLIEVLEE